MTPRLRTPRPPAGSPFSRPDPVPAASTRMSALSRVTHDRFGLGSVVRIVDDHDVIVDFGREDGAYHSVNHTSLTVL